MKLRADERDRVWQRDKAELPRPYRGLHACWAEAAKAEHARPPISDVAWACAVALLRNKRGIGRTLLELKALPEVAIASLAFIVRQIDVRLAAPPQCLTNLICLLPKPVGGERPIVLQSLLHVLWSSCHADSIRSWDAARERFLGLRCQRLQCVAVRCSSQSAGDFCKKWEVILGESTASVYWDLQKFYDSVGARHLLRLGAECGFPTRVAVVDLQVRLGLRVLLWAVAVAPSFVPSSRFVTSNSAMDTVFKAVLTRETSITLDHMKELKNNTFVGDTARWWADTRRYTQTFVSPSMVLVIMMNPSVGYR